MLDLVFHAIVAVLYALPYVIAELIHACVEGVPQAAVLNFIYTKSSPLVAKVKYMIPCEFLSPIIWKCSETVLNATSSVSSLLQLFIEQIFGQHSGQHILSGIIWIITSLINIIFEIEFAVINAVLYVLPYIVALVYTCMEGVSAVFSFTYNMLMDSTSSMSSLLQPFVEYILGQQHVASAIVWMKTLLTTVTKNLDVTVIKAVLYVLPYVEQLVHTCIEVIPTVFNFTYTIGKSMVVIVEYMICDLSHSFWKCSEMVLNATSSVSSLLQLLIEHSLGQHSVKHVGSGIVWIITSLINIIRDLELLDITAIIKAVMYVEGLVYTCVEGVSAVLNFIYTLGSSLVVIIRYAICELLPQFLWKGSEMVLNTTSSVSSFLQYVWEHILGEILHIHTNLFSWFGHLLKTLWSLNIFYVVLLVLVTLVLLAVGIYVMVKCYYVLLHKDNTYSQMTRLNVQSNEAFELLMLDNEHLRTQVHQHQEQLSMERDKSICVICLDNTREMVLKPCNHYCLCSSCSKGLRECPLCKKKIQRTEKIFHS